MKGSVGVISNIFFKILIVIEDVLDHSAQEGDIGAGAQGDVMIRQCRRSGKTGIHMDNFRPALSLARNTHLKEMGCISAALLPMIRITSAFLISM